jgi:hypothetical protein
LTLLSSSRPHSCREMAPQARLLHTGAVRLQCPGRACPLARRAQPLSPRRLERRRAARPSVP